MTGSKLARRRRRIQLSVMVPLVPGVPAPLQQYILTHSVPALSKPTHSFFGSSRLLGSTQVLLL